LHQGQRRKLAWQLTTQSRAEQRQRKKRLDMITVNGPLSSHLVLQFVNLQQLQSSVPQVKGNKTRPIHSNPQHTKKYAQIKHARVDARAQRGAEVRGMA
jgi:hypothetical protein